MIAYTTNVSTKQAILSDAALVIICAACAREDGSVYPLTSKLSGMALGKVLNSLLAKGLIETRLAAKGEKVWSYDEYERPETLRVTAAAYEVIGVEPPTFAPATEAAPAPKAEPAPAPKAARGDSKKSLLIAMLTRPQGASIDEISGEFGWKSHTVRGAISGSLRKEMNLTIESERVEGRGRVYRIPTAPASE